MGKFDTQYNTEKRREARKKKKAEDPVGHRAELNKRNDKNRILKEQNPLKYEEMRAKRQEKLKKQSEEEHAAQLARRRQRRQALASLTQLAVAAEVSFAAFGLASVFGTFSPDDTNHCISIRMCSAIKFNNIYPATAYVRGFTTLAEAIEQEMLLRDDQSIVS
jgi:hypothetical protein